MIDHSAMKLGKRPPVLDPRTLRLTRYLIPEALPPVPPVVDWSGPLVNFGMMRNDDLGDCTIAAAAHLVQVWTQDAAGAAVTIADSLIVAAYSAATGYNPADPNTDQGANELDILKFWRSQGIGTHKIGAYVGVNPTDHDHVRAALYLFGGLYIGLALPITAQRQAFWDVPDGGPTGDGEPGSWGGHAVCVVEFDQNSLTCITWGQKKVLTWPFWDTYTDEAYAILSPDWLAQNRAPVGLDLATLQADLQVVTAADSRP